MQQHQMALVKPAGIIARLWRTRALVWAVVLLERIWPLLLPFLILASLLASFAWLGLFRILPDLARLALLFALGLGALASLVQFRKFRLPTPGEIDRRIEGANKLEHAPITTQTDRLAGSSKDAFSDALWREHQKRMASKLYGLQADLPKTGIPQRDPYALRAAAALLFVIAAAYATGPYGGRLSDAFQIPAMLATPMPRIDAWVTPPPYTGRAPIFLTADANRDRQEFTVPENSTLSVRISGGSGKESLHLISIKGEQEIAPDQADVKTDAHQFSQILDHDGTVSLVDGARTVVNWQFVVALDEPPSIHFVVDPRRAANGALELSYRIEDDHGVVRADTHFELADGSPYARPLYGAPEMPLTLPRRSSDTHQAKSARDLSEHPWAGRTVDLTLSAIDADGQIGKSETKSFMLPQRHFTNSLSRALVEQRQVLALDANQKRHTLTLMDATLLWADEMIPSPAYFLLLSSIRSRLAVARNEEALRGVVDGLWQIALIIEDGDLTAAERRLRDAQEALRQALDQGATPEELKRLMDELRTAMQDFLREFAERAMENQDSAQAREGQAINPMDLERMLDQLEQLAQSGARDQAQELLSQLESLMNNLQAGQPQQGQEGQQQSEMRQQMDQLGEIIRGQQELLNETFRTDRQQEQSGQGESGPGQPEGRADALRQLQEGQAQLRNQLQGLTDALKGMGIKPGEGFGEAGEAMGKAEGALGDGQGGLATDEQGRALEALRRGAQDMMQQMQQAMEGQQGEGGQQGQRAGNSGRDPLGRQRATTRPDFGNSVDVPDEIDTQRAREILDAIRRRLGDSLSPEIERDYLERLLDLQ